MSEQTKSPAIPVIDDVVARLAELGTVEQWLAERGRVPQRVLVLGEALSGKSSLVRAVARRWVLSGQSVLHLRPSSPLVVPPAPAGSTRLVVVDEPLEWGASEEALWEELGARLGPSDALLVASRRRPDAVARCGDRVVRLGTLDPAATDSFLDRLGVPTAELGRIRAFANGDVALLALAADEVWRVPGGRLTSEGATRVLLSVARRLLPSSSPDVVRALGALALVQSLPAANLREACGVGDDTIGLLCNLPFVEESPYGLALGPLARRAFLEKLRVQAPAEVPRVESELRLAATRAIAAGGGASTGLHQLLTLERGVGRSPLERLSPDRADDDDREKLLDRLRHLFGDDEARRIAHWVEERPESLAAWRSGSSVVVLALTLDVTRDSPPEGSSSDPVMAVARKFLSLQGASRGLLLRASYPAPGASLDVPDLVALCGHLVDRLLSPDPASWMLVATATPEWFEELVRGIGLSATTIPSGVTEVPALVGVSFRERDLQTRILVDGLASALVGRLARRVAAVPVAPLLPRRESRPVDPGAEDGAFGSLLRARVHRLAEHGRLSPREREVLDLMLIGRNAAEIGLALSITARTAKFHQANVLSKLGAESKLDLMRLLL